VSLAEKLCLSSIQCINVNVSIRGPALAWKNAFGGLYLALRAAWRGDMPVAHLLTPAKYGRRRIHEGAGVATTLQEGGPAGAAIGKPS